MRVKNEFDDEIKEEELQRLFAGFMAYVERDGSITITRRAGQTKYADELTDEYIHNLIKAKAIRERIIRQMMNELLAYAEKEKNSRIVMQIVGKYVNLLKIENAELKARMGLVQPIQQ